MDLPRGSESQAASRLEGIVRLIVTRRPFAPAQFDIWYFCSRTADDGEVYYYNATSGDSSWEHPCDERFMYAFTSLELCVLPL